MARLVFPDEGSQFTYRIVGRAFATATGAAAVFYSDAAATVLADLLTHDGTATPGAPVAGSTLTVDENSLVPLFWGPDGADTVWAVVDGGPATAVYARADDRLDALLAGAAGSTAAVAAEAAARIAGDAAIVAGLGTAAAADVGDFDPAGSAAGAVAGLVPQVESLSTLTFNTDGSVTDSGTQPSTTTFAADGTITTVYGAPRSQTVLTTFASDGTITEALA